LYLSLNSDSLIHDFYTHPTRQIPIKIRFEQIVRKGVLSTTIFQIAFGWTGAAILTRGMVLSLRNQDFTAASRALGMGGVIILESALSFPGFGIHPPIPTWGNMLNEYQQDMWTQPAKVFYPGLMIFVATLAFNYVGDGLRDSLDPRLKN